MKITLIHGRELTQLSLTTIDDNDHNVTDINGFLGTLPYLPELTRLNASWVRFNKANNYNDALTICRFIFSS
jgi:hypothetical protein